MFVLNSEGKKIIYGNLFSPLKFFLVSVFTLYDGHMVISTPPSRLCLWHAANQIKLVSGTWWGPVWDKGGLFWTVNHCKLSQQNPAPLFYSLLVTTAHQLPPPHPITSILCHMDALHGAQNEHHSYLLKRTVVYRHRLFTVHNKPRHSFLASKSFWALVLLSPNFQLPFFFFFLNNEYTQKFNSHKIKYLIILSPLNNNALSILLLC